MEVTRTGLDRNEVLRYMGCPPEGADPTTLALVDQCARELLGVIRPRWTSRTCSIQLEEEGVRLEGGLLLPGRDLLAHLQGCDQVVLFCATLSAQADAAVRRAQSRDVLTALALDCCATVAVEQLCDQVEEEIHRQYPGCHFPFRFSPGYGDLPLTVQGPLLNLLDAPRNIGLCASSSHILTPRKSVTALIGVARQPIPQTKRSCLACPGRESCPYRKSGGHCGTA